MTKPQIPVNKHGTHDANLDWTHCLELLTHLAWANLNTQIVTLKHVIATSPDNKYGKPKCDLNTLRACTMMEFLTLSTNMHMANVTSTHFWDAPACLAWNCHQICKRKVWPHQALDKSKHMDLSFCQRVSHFWRPGKTWCGNSHTTCGRCPPLFGLLYP